MKRLAIFSKALLERRNVGPDFSLAAILEALDKFQLFVLGPRIGIRGELPKLRKVMGGHPLTVQVAGSTRVGSANAAMLK